MCGIFGWSWGTKRPTRRQREILAVTLGSLNDERGGHSWGWFAPDSNKLVKAEGAMGHHARVMCSHTLAMGHTRFATIGARTVENAHPFKFGKVTGAHNGSIWNHRMVAATKGWDHAVDSMTLVRMVAEGMPLDDLSGYGTLEWHDANERGIFLVKLSTGADLSIVSTEYGVVWSSSGTHLSIALRAAGVAEKGAFKLAVGEVVRALGGALFETGRKLEVGDYNDGKWVAGSMYSSAWEHWPRDQEDDVDVEVELEKDEKNEVTRDVESVSECCLCMAPLFVDEVQWEKADDEQYCSGCKDWAEDTAQIREVKTG